MNGDRSGLVVPALVIVWVVAGAIAVSSAFQPRPPTVLEAFDPPRAFVLLEGTYELVRFAPDDSSVVDRSEYVLSLPWSWSYTDQRVEVDGRQYLHVIGGGSLGGWYLPEDASVTLTGVESPNRPDPPAGLP